MPSTLDPTRPSDLLAWRGRGNPAAAHVSSAISNCFPGLEFDFRAAWKQIFESVELHEAHGEIIALQPGGAGAVAGLRAAAPGVDGDTLVEVDGRNVRASVTGPRTPGAARELLGEDGMEWSNSLALLFNKAGQAVNCIFRRDADGTMITAVLTVRQIFDGIGIAEAAAAPGVLTQGLCSPWQNDYRECGCYYWAASRPDYVNVELTGNTDAGHNWLQRSRTPTTPKDYTATPQVSYEQLFRAWETELRFVRRGQDSE